MSSETIELVKQFLTGNNINSNDTDSMFDNQWARGKHAKKVIDAHRTNQDYYKTYDVHRELLEHYENVDWYERDSSFDLYPYVEKL